MGYGEVRCAWVATNARITCSQAFLLFAYEGEGGCGRGRVVVHHIIVSPMRALAACDNAEAGSCDFWLPQAGSLCLVTYLVCIWHYMYFRSSGSHFLDGVIDPEN